MKKFKKINTVLGEKEIEMVDWKGGQIPKTVFKYRNWESDFDKKIILHQEIFIPSPDSFNDPYDCRIPVNYELLKTDKKIAEKYFHFLIQKHFSHLNKLDRKNKFLELKNDPKFQDVKYLNSLKETSIDELHKILGIYCVTAVNDNILMWSHYANNHSGFCVGFDSTKLFNYFSGGREIDYRNKFPNISPLEPLEKRMLYQDYIKASFWNYEIEYRLIKSNFSNKVLKLEKDVITHIIMGHKMNNSQRSDLIKITKHELPNTKIFEAKPKQNSFELEIKEI